MRILVGDDSKDIRERYRSVLEQFGHQVTEAAEDKSDIRDLLRLLVEREGWAVVEAAMRHRVWTISSTAAPPGKMSGAKLNLLD